MRLRLTRGLSSQHRIAQPIEPVHVSITCWCQEGALLACYTSASDVGVCALSRVQRAGLLQKSGVRFQVPDSALPRFRCTNAGHSIVNGVYVAEQMEGYVGPTAYRHLSASKPLQRNLVLYRSYAGN
jgi:hypothetical protein